MAQRASLRDQTLLAIEKRRSNRTVYVLRGGPEQPKARSGWLRARWSGTTGRWRSADGARTASF
jgi:hypothetical protein